MSDRTKPENGEWRLLKIEEVAERLRVSPRTVQRMVRRKQIPALRMGGRKPTIRFDPDAVRVALAKLR